MVASAWLGVSNDREGTSLPKSIPESFCKQCRGRVQKMLTQFWIAFGNPRAALVDI